MIRDILHQIKMFFFWGWNMRHDVDWDYSGYQQAIILKINRQIKELKNDPFCDNSREIRKMMKVKGMLEYETNMYEHYMKRVSDMPIEKIDFPLGLTKNQPRLQIYYSYFKDQEYFEHRGMEIFYKNYRKWWT